MSGDVFLGIDYGERRIGLAVGDRATGLACVAGTLTVTSTDDAVTQLSAVCRQRSVTHLVMGLPIRMDGSDSTVTRMTRAFGGRLAEETGLPLTWVDERLTTAMADRALISANVAPDKRKGMRDRMAAQILLQGYLDSRAFSAPISEGDPE